MNLEKEISDLRDKVSSTMLEVKQNMTNDIFISDNWLTEEKKLIFKKGVFFLDEDSAYFLVKNKDEYILCKEIIDYVLIEDILVLKYRHEYEQVVRLLI